MKYIKKILVLFLIIVLCGCSNNNEELINNIEFKDLGVVISDYGSKAILMYAKNNNTVNVSIDSEIKYTKDGTSGSEIAFTSLYPGEETYYLIDLINDITPDEYEIVNTVGSFKTTNYKKLYNNVVLTKSEETTIDNLVVEAKNDNNEVVNIYGIALFYKDDKIIAASEGDCIAENKSSCNMDIFIPVDDIESYESITYDREDILLSKISVGVD